MKTLLLILLLASIQSVGQITIDLPINAPFSFMGTLPSFSDRNVYIETKDNKLDTVYTDHDRVIMKNEGYGFSEIIESTPLFEVYYDWCNDMVSDTTHYSSYCVIHKGKRDTPTFEGFIEWKRRLK